MNLVRLSLVCLALAVTSVSAFAEAGVLIPSNIKSEPDDSIISLADMITSISIDDQFATVKVLQIFRNHTNDDIEGKYVFSLPDNAQVSNFAIWENGVRIPAVVVERQKASELYEELTAMKIDPGLAEQGEDDEQNLFTVRVYPIPAQGTKRIELSYTIAVPVQSLQSQFVFPLKPSLYSEQTASKFHIDFSLRSSAPIAGFQQKGNTIPLTFQENTAAIISGSYTGENVIFSEDFAIEYSLGIENSVLGVVAHRDPKDWQDLGPLSGGAKFSDDSGYFAAQAVFNQLGGSQEKEPLRVVLLIDTSVSMQWSKLQSCYQASEYFLKSLTDKDYFTLITFNEAVNAFSETLLPATLENSDAALSFYQKSYLRGGTDLLAALMKGIEIAKREDAQLIMISDGAPSAGEVVNNEISKSLDALNHNVKLMIFGLGNDAHIDLLERLAAENSGHFVWASDSEEIDFKLARFFESLNEPIIADLSFDFHSNPDITAVYVDTTTSVFDRTNITWLGRYLKETSAKFTVEGNVENQRLTLENEVQLPEVEKGHPQLPRRWAQLRVRHLEREIDKSEDPAAVEKMIEEIIFLSKKYTFVTRYTSFLAAPRSLLRPRAMRAGDPILRVKTVEGITSVVAHFPFGLTKPLHYVANDDAWETRFLAPAWMQDGEYAVDIYLTDEENTVYIEKKDFTIDNKPPSLRIEIEPQVIKPGGTVLLKVYADSDTRSILVRAHNLMPVAAKWDPEMKANVAKILIPADMAPGQYNLTISAVDFARNTATLTQKFNVEGN
jgi:Ca-activated chloride channel family protein